MNSLNSIDKKKQAHLSIICLLRALFLCQWYIALNHTVNVISAVSAAPIIIISIDGKRWQMLLYSQTQRKKKHSKIIIEEYFFFFILTFFVKMSPLKGFIEYSGKWRQKWRWFFVDWTSKKGSHPYTYIVYQTVTKMMRTTVTFLYICVCWKCWWR